MIRTIPRLAAILVAVVGILLGVLAAGLPAQASTSPSPSASAPAGGGAGSITAVPTCAQTDTTGCVSGTLRDSDTNPVAGVTLTLAPEGGAPVATKTSKQGVFSFAVTAAGKYTLTLDDATLPKGVKSTNGTERTPTVRLGALAPAGFALSGTVSSKETDSNPTGTGGIGRLWNQISLGLLLGLLLALGAIGLSLVYGTTGLSNFAHAEQVTLGGFLVYVFGIQLGVPFVLAAVIAVAICALTGTVQDRLIWQPLRRRGLGLTQLMVVTIGLQLALEYLYQYIFGGGVRNVSRTIQANTGPLNITPNAYVAMGISLVVLIVVGLLLTRTRIGRATRAVADNRPLAAASGIDVDGIIRLVWTVATGLAGLAGLLYALVYGGIAWNTGAELLLLLFAAVTLGGLGTAFGALVGSLIIGLVTQLSSLVLTAQLRYASALLILIVVLIFRPQGILGRRSRVG
ncbi:branched-chain amino acid ABC transporter permease [uncultured Amnibacterium sp.]|uniref:branched-chain amino acid ABC transporter permease n=1 Tax=uncultured Amnibacterium sp. TaxID=1631851 RepID=UPI0035CAFA70